MPDRHRLAIDRMATRVRPATGMAADWAAQIDAAMRGPLPARLGREIERRFHHSDAVIRIRRLQLVWRPQGDLPDMEGFADLLASRIAEAVELASTGGSIHTPLPEIRVWPDRPHYVAAWVRHRLGIARDADWAFPDFAALQVLTGPEAVTEFLAVSPPEMLVVLARTRPEAQAIALALAETGAWRVLAALIGNAAPSIRAIAVAQARMQAIPDPIAAPGVTVLAALLDPELAAVAAIDDLPSVAQAMLAQITLAAMLQAGAAMDGPDAILPPDLPDIARAALAACTSTPELRMRLLQSVPTSPARPQPTAPEPTAGRAPARPTPARIVHSAFAGLAPILALCPLPHAAPEVIRRIAQDLIPVEAQPDWALDPGMALLFPADPHVDPTPQADPPETAWLGMGTLAGAALRDGFGRYADLWLARFAARMQGLQGSSRAYLAREFLLRPGRIETGPDHLLVTLPPIPLGIVLRMSGLTGATPVIPHLGRRLLIEMER